MAPDIGVPSSSTRCTCGHLKPLSPGTRIVWGLRSIYSWDLLELVLPNISGLEHLAHDIRYDSIHLDSMWTAEGLRYLDVKESKAQHCCDWPDSDGSQHGLVAGEPAQSQ